MSDVMETNSILEAELDLKAPNADALNQDQTTLMQEYELNIPEGMEFTADERARFDAHARELNLDNKGAQKLLDMTRRGQLEQVEARQTQMNAWKDELYKDKHMGGSLFESTVAYAKAGLKKFDPDGQLLSLLEQTGYGNNPSVIRFLSAIGRTQAEDKVILGSPSKTESPRHERLYGKYNTL